MGRPECSEFLCNEWGFTFRDTSGAEVILCEEHARARGLSAGGESFHDPVPVRPAAEVEAEIQAKLSASPDELLLDEWLPAPETPKPKETPMARPVRRLDTQKIYTSLKEAADDVGGKGAGLCEAIRRCADYKGVRFVYADKAAPTAGHFGAVTEKVAPPPPPPPPTPAPAIIKATSGAGNHIRRIETNDGTPPSVTSIFAAMSSMAAGMKLLKLTDIEITTDGVCVKIAGIELSGN